MTTWADIATAPRDGTEFLAIGKLQAMIIASFALEPEKSPRRGGGNRRRVLVESFRKEVLHGGAAWATH